MGLQGISEQDKKTFKLLADETDRRREAGVPRHFTDREADAFIDSAVYNVGPDGKPLPRGK